MPRDSYEDAHEASWEDVLHGIRQRWRGPRPPRRLGGILIGLVVLIWLLTGLYMVGPGEQGVVRQFGKEVSRTGPGLRYRLPWPIQDHDKVDVAQVRRAEIGFRTVRGEARPLPQESLMLTGDENIVDAQLFVQYLVKDPSQFVFRSREPEDILHSAAEVALRSVVGRNTIDHTMTEGRLEVQEEVKEYLQSLLDLYQTGLLVTEARLLVVDPPDEVKDAFHEVVRAWEDRERLIKEAEAYREGIIPRARGEAQEVLRQAEAYKQQRIIRAQGDAAKFNSVYATYRKAKQVTRERLYVETMERILPSLDKIVVRGGGGGDMVQLLPLRDLWKGDNTARQ